jgi:hypothetical protein
MANEVYQGGTRSDLLALEKPFYFSDAPRGCSHARGMTDGRKHRILSIRALVTATPSLSGLQNTSLSVEGLVRGVTGKTHGKTAICLPEYPLIQRQGDPSALFHWKHS